MGQNIKLSLLLQTLTLAGGLSLLCLSSHTGNTAAQPLDQASSPTSKKTVVIDPGHGGNDTGVKGSAGTLEKEVALRLARLIENRLKGRYQVSFTRSDDYKMPWSDRTGHANHVKADLFISLHTAGSYSPATGGLRVYYYIEPEVKVPRHAPTGAPTNIPWRQVQKPHIPASNSLAQHVWRRARALTAPHPGTVQAAPAAVLAGADMPAILIETGYLTNPKQEKNLNDNKYLFKLATAISQGIDDFFDNPDKIVSTDLRE
ncbi:MAG: N-acetylmuramoyl-L-alanine amidase [Desulfobacterales bacterium]|nr:N-acetylmuramoyl-L-alanine amidase [Desulfobacterales bacterium]